MNHLKTFSWHFSRHGSLKMPGFPGFWGDFAQDGRTPNTDSRDQLTRLYIQILVSKWIVSPSVSSCAEPCPIVAMVSRKGAGVWLPRAIHPAEREDIGSWVSGCYSSVSAEENSSSMSRCPSMMLTTSKRSST